MLNSSHRPALVFSAFCFCSAVLANLLLVNWWSNPFWYTLGAFMLATPFVVLFIGQIRFARTWKRTVFFVFGNLVFGVLWGFATFVMLWLQPGLLGLILLSGVLVVLAGAYAFLSKCVNERGARVS